MSFNKSIISFVFIVFFLQFLKIIVLLFYKMRLYFIWIFWLLKINEAIYHSVGLLCLSYWLPSWCHLIMINNLLSKLYCVFSIKSCWPLWVVVVGRCVVVTGSCVVFSGSIWWWLHKSPWQQPPVSESSGFPLDRRPKIELAWTCKLSQT